MKTICTCLAFLLGVNIFSQSIIYPDYSPTAIYSMAVSDNHIYALGTCDYLLYSSDEGLSFNRKELAANIDPISILGIPGETSKAYLLSDDQLYYFNNDMTTDPIDVSSITSLGALRQMDADDTNIYIISNGAIFASPHENISWSKISDISYIDNYTITAFQVNDGSAYTGTSLGHIFISDVANGGFDLLSKESSRITRIQMVNNNIGYATAQNEIGPLKTTDGGSTWFAIQNWPENNPVVAYDENILLTYNTNRYFVSTDGGLSNIRINQSEDENVALIFTALYTEDGTLYMGGQASTVTKSEDFGISYQSINPNFKGDIYFMDMTTSGFGIAATSFTVGITQDGGSQWTFENILPQISTVEDVYISDIDIIDDQSYIVSHNLGYSIFRLGENPEHYFGVSINALHYHPEYILAIITVGTDNVIAKSTNNSVFENKVFLDDYPSDFKVSDSGAIYITGKTGGYYISNDDGETWTGVALEDAAFINDILIDGNDICYATNNSLLLSQNNGNNFEQISTGFGLNNINIAPDGKYTFTSTQNSQMNLFSFDPTTNTKKTEASFCASANCSVATDDGTVYYGLRFGSIVKYPQQGATAVTEKEQLAHSIIPTIIQSGQSISIKSDEIIKKITIYNQLGQLVNTTNCYSKEISTEPIFSQSGLYFVETTSINNTTGISKIYVSN